MPIERKIPPAPRGVGQAGKRAWSDLWGTYSFDPHEIHRVEEYVRVVDRLAFLRAKLLALPDDELLLYDRAGRPYVHPLESQVDAKSRLAAVLLKALDLPKADSAGRSPSSLVAQHAARSRFAQTARSS